MSTLAERKQPSAACEKVGICNYAVSTLLVLCLPFFNVDPARLIGGLGAEENRFSFALITSTNKVPIPTLTLHE
jgi:hypothetical protein